MPESHATYMERCFHLAQQGLGSVAPNPLVGSVIVKDGRIIGEGYHRNYGGPHAEVHAVRSVNNPEDLKDATIYVNLEPCAHHGKTPPCADLIVESGIPRVVIANRDPFDQVDGKGIERLRQAGIEVEVGVLESKGLHLNRRFFTFHTQQRPYVILKWAQTTDGYIDHKRQPGDGATPLKVSGPESHRLSHRWRTEEAAILVGTQTALLDNPSLTAREWPGNHPTRVVLDRNGRLHEDLQLFDGAVRTLVLGQSTHADRTNLEHVSLAPDADWGAVLKEIHRQKLQSVIVEGGAQLLSDILKTDLWDEARVFISPDVLGSGVKAPPLPVDNQQSVTNSGRDRLHQIFRR